MNTMANRTLEFGKRTGRGIAQIAEKTKDYTSGMGKLIWKDVKTLPAKISKVPSGISRAVRSKIEINIIVPEAKKPEAPVQDQDLEVLHS